MPDLLDKCRAPVRRLTGVQVLATGSYVPEHVVRNDDLAALGIDADWILQRTGIHERRFAEPGACTSDLALAAARRCIAAAGVTAADIDLVILATFTPDDLAPATACLVQHKLGINAPALDIQNARAGFVYALVAGMQFVATGCSSLALVIGADCNSRIIDPHDARVYPLFGDGAGAVLLCRGTPEQGLSAYTLGSDGEGYNLLRRNMGGSRLPASAAALAAGEQFLRMDGRAVFKWAIRVLQSSIADVAAAAGIAPQDIDLLILHQANIRILDAAVETLQLDRGKLFVNLDRYGNTSAGSVPLALDEAVRQGRVRRGDRLLLSGFGAGLAWGTALLTW